MTAEELRLECLKLTYAHGRTAEDAVERAKLLEQYLFLESRVPKQKTLTLPETKPTSR
jgi:hypothetical protein